MRLMNEQVESFSASLRRPIAPPTPAYAPSPAIPANTSVPSDVIVLIASNGTSHTTSRTLLSAHSPFFADIFALPTPSSASAKNETLDLSLASSAGLTLILAVLEHVGPASSPFSLTLPPSAYKYWLALTSDDLPVLAEAAICARAYDISTFYTGFVRRMLHRLEHQPIMRFALAAITHADADIPDSASTLLRTGIRTSQLPSDIIKVIETYAPDTLDRYKELRREYAMAVQIMQPQMRSKLPILNEVNDFSVKCRGDKKGYAACAAYLRHTNWRKMREGAAENVLQAMAGGGGTQYEPLDVRKIVEGTVPCDKCTSRLENVFREAMKPVNLVCASF